MTASRRASRPVRVADKTIGGDAPILVQSMTNTDTEDAKSTADQVAALARAGSEIVRITVNTVEAGRQVPDGRYQVQVRYAQLSLEIMGSLFERQKAGVLSNVEADRQVWRRLAA